MNTTEILIKAVKAYITDPYKRYAMSEMKQALTAYEKSKEEPACKTCLNYDGSGWCMLHKFNVGEQQVCPNWFQEPEQK